MDNDGDKKESLFSLFKEAASRDDIDSVKKIISDGLCLNTQYEGGLPPIIWSFCKGYEKVYEYLIRSSKPSHINAVDRKGNSLLMWFVNYNIKEGVELLIQNRANVNIKNRKGITPLILASKRGHKSIVEKLLQCQDIDDDAADRFGDTAFVWATGKRYRDITALFYQKKGIDIYKEMTDRNSMSTSLTSNNNLLLSKTNIHSQPSLSVKPRVSITSKA